MMQINNNEFKELGFEPFLSEYLDETYKYYLNKETKVLLSVYKDNFIIETGCFINPDLVFKGNIKTKEQLQFVLSLINF